ncbi:type II CRISPR-associated endonuclease Cas1 [Caldimonas thermodepolymerans]|jgi:CRISPR-associated protein Cas1|uniref:CRISPR-associated endonuclease Cas1 n=1 Tax=Caldimonas thermodepolymerans TaxID=215580 RepID=A0AA46DG07_9BURK|nr:type II CRISPR-associated endonuclease Cas1 [Caldimonas thermodepolymerans]TCP08223.1 CRISPR-associated protein Cas1 [Caldimonas thermodepolymerans]UZG48662.1 type II CRISPR-associated endonuclease Cas1 [Caldimonas thermodepolymerans]
MVWRSIVINHPARLHRDHFSLVVEQDEPARIPLEDIAVIVLNNRQITLTHPVLSACAEYGIGLYATGENHLPSGVFLPFLSHRRATRMFRLQLALGKPAAKQTWSAVVQRKILNQAACLKLMQVGDHERLSSYARRVRSGDAGNMEAQASAYYFPQLFGRNFHRSRECWVNAALNYGYAVIRGAIARSLVAHGLLPSVGVFHSSEQNAFNLADDMIEAYRPLIDLHVAKHRPSEDRELTARDKADLVGLLHVDVGMPRGVTSVIASIEQATESLVRVYESGVAAALELPVVIGLRRHRAEM